jgi:hypothetical protein
MRRGNSSPICSKLLWSTDLHGYKESRAERAQKLPLDSDNVYISNTYQTTSIVPILLL